MKLGKFEIFAKTGNISEWSLPRESSGEAIRVSGRTE